MPLIPTLRRQKQEDPWGSLANQSSEIGKPQLPVKDLVSKNKVVGIGRWLKG